MAKLNKIADSIKSNMNSLHSNIYSSKNNQKELKKLKSDIFSSIDTIGSNNKSNTGYISISRLTATLRNTDNKPTANDIDNIFGDQNLMNSLAMTYMQNREVKEYDDEIDMILKYMPKLEEALETKKDYVLSPDHFGKDFLKLIKSHETDADNNTSSSTFENEVSAMKTKYMLQDLLEESYDKTSRYGEDFIYCVPYSKAVNRLLKNKQNTYNPNTINITTESGELKFNDKKIDVNQSIPNNTNVNLHVEILENYMIESFVKDCRFVNQNKKILSENSIVQEVSVFDNNRSDKVKSKNQIFDKLIDDDLSFDPNTFSQDGTYINAKESIDAKITAKGAIIKEVPRHHVIPIYIDDTCMGFYYFEFKDNDSFEQFSDKKCNSIVKSSDIMQKEQMANTDELILKSIASSLSQMIDAKFVNNHQDLSKDIYAILKYNDIYNSNIESTIRVSFIPPEDMYHLYFKKCPITNRGISDLAKALLPAKLWVALSLTYMIGNMTRGQDKRVYYVKQQVDTNISQSLMNVINQIKRSNFGIRQIENINNILNIIGKFNDYVIPTNSSGESPVNFEVIQGQQIDPPTEMMEKLEEWAVNSTDVPLEVIQARMQMDYAVHYTMSNTRFLKRVQKRQAICILDRMYSGLFTTIYNLEYNRNTKLKLALPEPIFLDITNTSQLIQNANDLASNIADIYLTDEEDETVKNIFTKKIKMEYLSSYINKDLVDEIYTKSKIEAAKKKIEGNSEDEI